MTETRRYAAETTVPVERTKAEIERALVRYGADGFMSGWDAQTARASLGFRFKGRHIRITLPLPKASDYKWAWGTVESTKQRRVDQDTRQRWRALLLVVKAKLEAVESKVSTFDAEFLPYVVMPDGRTVQEIILPQIEIAYARGAGGLRLLPGPVEDEPIIEATVAK